MPSRTNTPRPDNRQRLTPNSKVSKSPSPQKKVLVTCDSDIEPEDLVPVYLQTKAKLLELEWPQENRRRNKNHTSSGGSDSEDLTIAKLHAKIDRIEKDVLFEQRLAEQQWKVNRIALEKELVAARKQKAQEAKANAAESAENSQSNADDGVNADAERIAQEVLAEAGEDSEDNLADLFASLPVAEVDEATGKTNTVINGKDGARVVIRDFGKWAGVSPMRVLEEACRSRYVRFHPNL